MAIAILIGVIFLTNWGQNVPPAHPQERPVLDQRVDTHP